MPGPIGSVVVVVVAVSRFTRVVTQSVTSACNMSEVPVGAQPVGSFASSFAKQPLVKSMPPVYVAVALTSQVGSGVFPGVCAAAWHLRRPPRSFATHFFLLTKHFD